MSVNGKKKRSKDTFIRNIVHTRMIDNLNQGKEYMKVTLTMQTETGGHYFFHPLKHQLLEMKQPSRYRK